MFTLVKHGEFDVSSRKLVWTASLESGHRMAQTQRFSGPECGGLEDGDASRHLLDQSDIRC